MVSLTQECTRPPHYFVPLSNVEGVAINELLSLGCKLYYQRGKERIYADPQVQPSHVIPGNRALGAPCPCDSVGLDVSSLPSGVGIIDLDNAGFVTQIKECLGDVCGLSIEKTPSGGLHIWGKGIPDDAPKSGLSVAGLRLEYFRRGRITIVGSGRAIIRWTPLGQIADLPSPLLPARGENLPEIKELIPFGRRWNSLYEQVKRNSYLDEEALSFQARILCKPPLEADKEEDLQNILSRRLGLKERRVLSEEESLEESVSKKLAKRLADRWIFRLPDKEWYKYANGHWSTHEGASYEIMNDIEDDLGEMRGEYPTSNKRRMGTLQFRKLMEEYLKQRLYKTPKPLKGVHFTNGLLVVQNDKRELLPPEPGLWSFNQCGIALDQCTRLTEVQKKFLLSLTDGDPLKLNVIRAFLRLLFTHDNSEQFCLYLWGPGATGKSTFVQLLEHILGDAACALDILRLTNRFEMKVVQDKILITLPDIPLKVNDAQCSMIKKFVSGDKIVIEIKNGSIYVVSIVSLLLVTSNTKWCVQDRTSGFRRRALYVLTPKAAAQRDPFLLKKLKGGASGLINWALDMPAERSRIGQGVEAINELSGGGLDSSGVLEWLFAKVRYNPAGEIPLGAKKIPLAGGLYESYVKYAEAHGIEPVSYCSFGDVLDDSVRSLGYRDIVTKRRAQGRIVIGVSLGYGEPIRRSKRSAVVKYLMEAEPWEGFSKDKEAFALSFGEDDSKEDATEDDEESFEGSDDAESVEDVEFLGNRENIGQEERSNRATVGCKEAEREEGPPMKGLPRIRTPKRPLPSSSALLCLVNQKVGSLTVAEGRRTEEFLSKHPRLVQSLSSMQEDWTEDRLLQEAKGIVRSDDAVKEAVGRLYAARVEGTATLDLPKRLSLSTTMEGIEYPLALRMEEGIGRLRRLPADYLELITTLNVAAAEIVDTCYMLFRLFRSQGSTYYKRGCPVKGLFATTYDVSSSYPRLVPRNNHGSGTIASLRRDCKRVIKTLVEKNLLPDALALDELDMVACHTGIYAGLAGKETAPQTWEAYSTGNFWDHILSKWGGSVPKKLLKGILYSGLNGASLRGRGAIRDKVKEMCGGLGGVDFEDYLQEVLRHPILLELALFQSSLGRREKIYLPSRLQPYYGKVEEEQGGKRGGSRYHEGLLSSRALASHEVVLLAYIVESISRNGLGVPLSLENDGLLILTRASSRNTAFTQLDASLQSCSLDFLGVKIPLERKI